MVKPLRVWSQLTYQELELLARFLSGKYVPKSQRPQLRKLVEKGREL